MLAEKFFQVDICNFKSKILGGNKKEKQAGYCLDKT